MKLLLIPLAILEILVALIEIPVTIVVGCLAVVRVWLCRDYDYKRWLKRDLADCESILELGCGSNSPILQKGYGHKTIAIDIWQPYVDMHNRQGDYKCCFSADILNTVYLDRSKYDAVVILDVLEHLPKDKVLDARLFESMEHCARKKVIIFTPNGFMENDLADGDPYQAHVSAWEPVDYTSRGYTVRGTTGFRWLLGKASLPKWHPYSVCAIIAMLSKLVIFNKPKWAWHSYAVKEIKGGK